MIDFVLRSLLILYFGVAIRFVYLRYFKNIKTSYMELLNGIKNPKTPDEELFNRKNEFINNIYAIFLIFIIVLIIGICQKFF
ncbi:hypothetical protein TRIP_D380034 [uncultured Paludibacter sp.]|uniref:Uncharacterized protein n=1 Tax=uncultured Paludibacter sp. TaxID=497635 RepID=A0A653ADB1_9BACT|nr:hypothetical protein TRIP_D380034 [uncultured Paludibacter sp.]